MQHRITFMKNQIPQFFPEIVEAQLNVLPIALCPWHYQANETNTKPFQPS